MYDTGCSCGKAKKSKAKEHYTSDIKIGHEFDLIATIDQVDGSGPRQCNCVIGCDPTVL